MTIGGINSGTNTYAVLNTMEDDVEHELQESAAWLQQQCHDEPSTTSVPSIAHPIARNYAKSPKTSVTSIAGNYASSFSSLGPGALHEEEVERRASTPRPPSRWSCAEEGDDEETPGVRKTLLQERPITTPSTVRDDSSDDRRDAREVRKTTWQVWQARLTSTGLQREPITTPSTVQDEPRQDEPSEESSSWEGESCDLAKLLHAELLNTSNIEDMSAWLQSLQKEPNTTPSAPQKKHSEWPVEPQDIPLRPFFGAPHSRPLTKREDPLYRNYQRSLAERNLDMLTLSPKAHMLAHLILHKV